jgi:hypothetical protein
LTVHRPDRSLLGAFSARGVREEAVLRTAEDDLQGYPIYNGSEAYAEPVRRMVRAHMNCPWKRFLKREKRWLEARRGGQLAKTLARALPAESQEEIDRIALEDRRWAEKRLVELRSAEGQLFHKHIDDLLPKDRRARIRAELAHIEWLPERQQRRNLFRQGGSTPVSHGGNSSRRQGFLSSLCAPDQDPGGEHQRSAQDHL